MAYRQQLDSFAHDLILICDLTQKIMTGASTALLNQSLGSAERVLSTADELDELRLRCERQAVALLSLETPAGRDLRQVVSSIYIVEDFARMGALGMHIASAARRRHPQSTIPSDLRGFFEELARLVTEMSDKIRMLLIEPNADVALDLASADDTVDDIHHFLMRMITTEPWSHSTCSAVDTALLLRFYERYADHTVNVAARIVYLTTGLQPSEYVQKRKTSPSDYDSLDQWPELKKQFGSDF